MRTTVDLEPTLLKQLRIEARRRGVTVKELLSALLRRGLHEKRAPQKPFKLRTFKMGQPGFNVDKALGFASDLEDMVVIEELRRRK